jgi:hypothetical protein
MNNKFIPDKVSEEVINEFDFKQCHALMVLLDHRWGHNGKVPSKKEIKNKIKGMIENMNNTKSEYSSSGGLNLYYCNCGDDPFLELTYSPISSCSFINWNEV